METFLPVLIICLAIGVSAHSLDVSFRKIERDLERIYERLAALRVDVDAVVNSTLED